MTLSLLTLVIAAWKAQSIVDALRIMEWTEATQRGDLPCSDSCHMSREQTTRYRCMLTRILKLRKADRQSINTTAHALKATVHLPGPGPHHSIAATHQSQWRKGRLASPPSVGAEEGDPRRDLAELLISPPSPLLRITHNAQQWKSSSQACLSCRQPLACCVSDCGHPGRNAYLENREQVALRKM